MVTILSRSQWVNIKLFFIVCNFMMIETETENTFCFLTHMSKWFDGGLYFHTRNNIIDE